MEANRRFKAQKKEIELISINYVEKEKRGCSEKEID